MKKQIWIPTRKTLTVSAVKISRGTFSASIVGASAALCLVKRFKSSKLHICRDYVAKGDFYLVKREVEATLNRREAMQLLRKSIAEAA